MDDSQSLGDIAHASALNDGQLLFTLLSNYLYGFVSARLSVFETCRFFLSVVLIPSRGKTSQFLQPSDAGVSSLIYILFSFWKENEYNLPCGIRLLSEPMVKTEVGRMQLPDDTIYRGHNCFALRKYKTVSSVWCSVWDKRWGRSSETQLCRVSTLIITHIWALLWLILKWPQLEASRKMTTVFYSFFIDIIKLLFHIL